MSENDPQPEQPASIAFVGNETAETITFQDGSHVVPGYVVSGLGGAKELNKIAPGLQNVTFAAFMDGFHKVMTSRAVNEYQAQFVRNHFGQYF